MPMYEFKCENCGHHFETLVFSSNKKVTCPKCKGIYLKRLISACGFHIGGSSGCGSTVSKNSCGVGSGFT